MTNEIMNRHHSLLDGFVRILAFKNELCYMCLFFLFLTLPYAASQNTGNSTQWQSNDDPYDYSSDFFSPSMGIALVVIIVALFIFGCCSVFCRSCNGENIGLPGISLRGISIHGREGMSRRGLDPATIETFPTFSYSYVKGHHLGKGALECAVCLNEFEDQDTLRLLPKCDHVFHPECIDAWLCNRTTCPVCRANVASATGFSVHDMEDDSDEEIATSGAGDVENQQVTSEAPEAVAVGAAAAEPRTKPARAKFMGRFPRSNSTGHSLVQPGEDIERFTLRLPDEVRKQVMNMRQLNRTWSMVSLPRVGSSRKGYRTTGEGSSRGGRSMWEKPENWVLSMTPSFLMRAPSPRSSKMTEEERAPATPPRVKPFKSPLRMFSKANGTESASTRPLV